MKKVFLFIILIVLVLVIWDTSATPEKVASQLRGNGCIFDETCGSHWSWWKMISTRAPEYRCRMMAAICLGKLGSTSPDILSQLKAARSEKPETFDTGDGVIEYGTCIDSIIMSLEGKQNKDPRNSFACQS